MTYKECKLAALQKMFSAGAEFDETDDTIDDYLGAMPYAINEAIHRIVAVRPLRKSTEISVNASEREQGLNMEEVAYDYKNAGNLEVYLLNEDNVPEKIKYVRIVAGKYLIIPPVREDSTVILYYDAVPTRIKPDTKDDARLPLDEDACTLIPLYVAAELYKDDDITVATYYMNEFENGLALLVKQDSGILTDQFTSESGW